MICQKSIHSISYRLVHDQTVNLTLHEYIINRNLELENIFITLNWCRIYQSRYPKVYYDPLYSQSLIKDTPTPQVQSLLYHDSKAVDFMT